MEEIECSSVHFNNIKNGRKIYEGRPNKPKYSSLEVGSKLRIKNSDNLSEYVDVIVVSLHVYKSFREMIQDKGIENVLPDETGDGVNVYRQWYTKDVEKEFGALCIGISVSKNHQVLYSMYVTFNKLYPGEVSTKKYIKLLQKNIDFDLYGLLGEYSNILYTQNVDFPYFAFRYYVGDLSFLNEYSDNVRNFFITLINDNNSIYNVFYEATKLYMSLISSVDELIEIMDCLYKNDFLQHKTSSREQFLEECNSIPKKSKLDIIFKRSGFESKMTQLNFNFLEEQETHFLNSLFLTDNYFSENLDQYTFNFNFERREGFCQEIINYLVTGTGHLDSTFAEICSIPRVLYPLERDSYFNRTIHSFEDLKYVQIEDKFILFTKKLYFIAAVRKLSRKEINNFLGESDFLGRSDFSDVYDTHKKILSALGVKFSEEKIKRYINKTT